MIIERNWLVRIFNSSDLVIEKFRIMDRSEREAEKEAISYINTKHSGKSWSMIPLVLRKEAVERCVNDTTASYIQEPRMLDDFIRKGTIPWGGGIEKMSNKKLEDEYITRFAYDNVAIVDDFSKIPEL